MIPGQARARLVQTGAALVAAVLVAGCGNQYRPVVNPINPSGPPSQPSSYAAVVSAPSPTSPGIATIIDYSGDTVVAQAPIGPGPVTFSADESGSQGYTINSDGTLSNFPLSSSLQAKQVAYTTLPTTALTVNLFSPSTGLWASDQNGDVADVFTGNPETFRLAVPVAPTLVAIGGPGIINLRNYTISQNIPNATGMECNLAPHGVTRIGEADAIELASFTVSAKIPLGICPVYSVETPDVRRFFVLNRGSDTITVINSQLNTLDDCTPFVNQNGRTVTCHPSLPLSTSAGLTGANVPALAGPVYAEFNQATSQLIVANYDGGTVSVIDVSLDEYGNDSATFGTTFTIPVGHNPASVTVLNDGSRAYTADQADSSVTIVNLISHTVEKALPIIGHPRNVVSTQNSLYGKVYVASPDSPYLTILRTDQDIVDTTVLVEGNIVDVRVTTQNALSVNNNNSSRRPGFGQPCNLPPSPTILTLADCRKQP
jgi:hypothetical protein